MKLRFQADADLNQIIVSATVRREPSIDFQIASAAGFEGLSDSQVLERAAQEGRLLVSHDQTTMPRHFSDFIAARRSPGVIIVPQHLALAAAVEELIFIWAASDAREWKNRICFLPL